LALCFYEGRGRVPKSLEEGDLILAMMKATFLKFPEIEPENMAKLEKAYKHHNAIAGRFTGLGGVEKPAPVESVEAEQNACALEIALSASSRFEKFNPWHDLLGMFTDAAHAVSDAIVGTANAGEAPKRLPKNILSYDHVVGLMPKHNLSGQSNELMTALVYKESGFDANAQPPFDPNQKKTALGLTPMTEDARFDVGYRHADMTKPELAIEAGSLYLKQKIAGAYGDVREGLIHYAVGRNAKQRQEGEAYADKILIAEKALMAKPRDPIAVLKELHKK
jgi:hypothetical protein